MGAACGCFFGQELYTIIGSVWSITHEGLKIRQYSASALERFAKAGVFAFVVRVRTGRFGLRNSCLTGNNAGNLRLVSEPN